MQINKRERQPCTGLLILSDPSLLVSASAACSAFLSAVPTSVTWGPSRVTCGPQRFGRDTEKGEVGAGRKAPGEPGRSTWGAPTGTWAGSANPERKDRLRPAAQAAQDLLVFTLNKPCPRRPLSPGGPSGRVLRTVTVWPTLPRLSASREQRCSPRVSIHGHPRASQGRGSPPSPRPQLGVRLGDTVTPRQEAGAQPGVSDPHAPGSGFSVTQSNVAEARVLFVEVQGR